MWGGGGIYQVRSCEEAPSRGGGGGGGGGGGNGGGQDGRREEGADGRGRDGGPPHLAPDLTSLNASPLASSAEASFDLPGDPRSVAQMAHAAAMALGEHSGA